MVLSKKEALLVRSVVFSFLLRDRNDDVRNLLQELLEKIDGFLLTNDASTLSKEEFFDGDQEDDDVDEDDDEEDEVEDLEVDELFSVEKFVSLPLINVQHGAKTSLEFEENEDTLDSVTAVFGDHEETFEIVALQLVEGGLNLHKLDGGVVECKCAKFPKKWIKTFEPGKMYGVGEDDEEDEEEDE